MNSNKQSALAAFRSRIVPVMRSIARLLMTCVLMFVGLLIVSVISGPPGRKRPAPLDVAHQLVSPKVQMVVIPLTMFSIFFGAFYLNIRRAKKRVSHWKPGSSYWFIRSNGLVGVKARATRV
jgi:hypothetical protein